MRQLKELSGWQFPSSFIPDVVPTGLGDWIKGTRHLAGDFQMLLSALLMISWLDVNANWRSEQCLVFFCLFVCLFVFCFCFCFVFVCLFVFFCFCFFLHLKKIYVLESILWNLIKPLLTGIRLGVEHQHQSTNSAQTGVWVTGKNCLGVGSRQTVTYALLFLGVEHQHQSTNSAQTRAWVMGKNCLGVGSRQTVT